MSDSEMVHVVFELDVVDGWPPVSAERVWAAPVGPDLYRVENIPWFVRNLAAGDVVRATAPSVDSWPHFVERVEWSGNCTVRLIPFNAGPLNGSLQAVIDAFTSLGVQCEGAGTYPIVAMGIPPSADLSAIKTLVQAGQADGSWDVEESCIGDAWHAA